MSLYNTHFVSINIHTFSLYKMYKASDDYFMLGRFCRFYKHYLSLLFTISTETSELTR